jgi:Integral membrane protein S linking to the trans Golgi network
MAGRRSNAVAVNQGDKAVAPASQGGRAASGTRNKMNDFNPKLIFSQIVAIQCFHYLFLGFIFQVNHVFFSTAVTIDRIFTGKYLNLWSIEGWADNAAILFSYIFG